MWLREKVNKIKKSNATCECQSKGQREVQFDKPEYNEDGLNKPDNIEMGKSTINYGDEQEKQHFEKIFKPLIIFLACFLILAGVVIFIAVKFIFFS